MTVEIPLSAWRKVFTALVYSLIVTPCNSPCACSMFKVKVFEPYPDAFIWCALEHIATIDISRVPLWIFWTLGTHSDNRRKWSTVVDIVDC